MNPAQLMLLLALIADGAAARLGEAARQHEAQQRQIEELRTELKELKLKT